MVLLGRCVNSFALLLNSLVFRKWIMWLTHYFLHCKCLRASFLLWCAKSYKVGEITEMPLGMIFYKKKENVVLKIKKKIIPRFIVLYHSRIDVRLQQILGGFLKFLIYIEWGFLLKFNTWRDSYKLSYKILLFKWINYAVRQYGLIMITQFLLS